MALHFQQSKLRHDMFDRCPENRQSALISALIKPIGLCDTQNAHKFFGDDRKNLTPSYHAKVRRVN